VGLSGAAAWPFFARAQQSERAVVGVLHSGSPGPFSRAVEAFREGLRETGFIEGQDVTVEYRWAEGEYGRLPALAAELVRANVTVIAAMGGNAPAQAARAATSTIPIVLVSGGDPVAAGLVTSLNRPGGNVTGVSWVATAVISKQLELLRGLIPDGAALAALINPSYPEHEVQLRELKQAGATIGQNVEIIQATTADEISTAFISFAQHGLAALLVANDPFFVTRRDQLVALAAQHRVAAMYFSREFTIAGGLLSYGADLVDATRQAGVYVGKVLRGVSPADLPVQQASRFELVINLATAKTLGIAVPATLLALADEVIE
jgi:putative ABC transport system substrate-binding protein